MGNGNFVFVKGREDKNGETNVWMGNRNGVTRFSEGSSVIGVVGDSVLIGDYLEPVPIGGDPAKHRWFVHGLNGNRQFAMPLGYPTVLGSLNNHLMVTAADKSVTPAKSFLWTIDGTQAGNTRLTALNGTSIESGAEFKGHFYFGFDAAYAGRELWVTDGTRSGTQQFARLNTRITLEPRDFHVQDDWLYFTARHNNDKREIWRTNGNSAETTPVTSATQSNFTLSPSFYAPFSFTATGDALYFTALDTNQVSQLWRLSVEGVTACMIPPSGPWPPCARGGLIQ